jgi:hypothetical protein
MSREYVNFQVEDRIGLRSSGHLKFSLTSQSF